VAELGQVLRHRVGDLQPAVLDHLHQRDADDRLGHRIDAEDRVLLHRIGRRDIALALDRHPRDLAASRHQHHRTRQQPVVDMRLGRGLDLLELDRGKPDFFRRRRHRQSELRVRGAGDGHEGHHREAALEHVHVRLSRSILLGSTLPPLRHGFHVQDRARPSPSESRSRLHKMCHARGSD
jgi:hypothetical protein